MPRRWRNVGSLPLNYAGSGGPEVAPGAAFEHDIPLEMAVMQIASGSFEPLDEAAAPPAFDDDLPF